MRIAILLLSLLMPLTCWASQANDKLLFDLKTKASEIRNIASDFTQEKHLAIFDEVLVSQGHFAFEKPGSLRWEYTSPFRAGFLLKDGKGKEWDEATATTRDFSLNTSPAMSMVAKQIMAWTTFDIEWLKSRYKIRQLTASPIALELKPRSEIAKEFLAHLVVSFTSDNRAISSLELHEIDGDFTKISFTTPALNSELAQETFTTVQ